MDVLHDQSHRQFIGIAETYDVPEYVMENEVPTKEAYDGSIPDSLFADPVHRMFPVDTAANTWLSAAYFKEAADSIRAADLRELVHDRIVKAAGAHGNIKDVQAVLSFTGPASVDPSELDANYAYVVKDAAGRSACRRYPIYDRAGLKLACDYFARNRSSYSTADRTKIAAGILRRAAELGEDDVPSLVNKEAGYAVPYRPTLLAELLERAKLTKDAESATVIATLVEVVGFATADELIKSADEIVAVIDDLDVLNGMTRHYGRDLLSPREVVYSMDIKEAESLVKDTVTLNRLSFSTAKLAELGPDVFRDVLGDAIIAEISNGQGKLDASKMAAVLPTLPRPDKVVLEDSILRQCEDR